jgi:hypothetical protein
LAQETSQARGARGRRSGVGPTLGFSAFLIAQRFWRAFEEVRQYLRPRQTQIEIISLAQRRTQFLTRVKVLESMFQGG